MSTKTTLSEIGIAKVARKFLQEANNIPVITIPGGAAPKSKGSHHWFRWLGKWKSAPGSYQASTRRILVGEKWNPKAPKGMEFKWTKLGLAVIRQSDGMDYHPTFEDLRAKNFATNIRNKMAANYKLRIQTNKQKREFKRIESFFNKDLDTTRVTLIDSRKAGNCIEGSLKFAERYLGIPREEVLNSNFAFPAKTLLRMAGDQKENVWAAIRQAWERETTISI